MKHICKCEYIKFKLIRSKKKMSCGVLHTRSPCVFHPSVSWSHCCFGPLWFLQGYPMLKWNTQKFKIWTVSLILVNCIYICALKPQYHWGGWVVFINQNLPQRWVQWCVSLSVHLRRLAVGRDLEQNFWKDK